MGHMGFIQNMWTITTHSIYLQELSVVVKKPSKKGKSKTQKRFAAELWPFLYVLANHFATMDLSRPCVYGDC